jgi:hypothetical protein
VTAPANQSESDTWLSSISAPLTGTPVIAAKQAQAAQGAAASTLASAGGPLSAPFAAQNIAKEEGSSGDIAYNPEAPHLTQAAAAANHDVATQTARVQQWNQSGLNTQLSTLLSSGNYAGAFAAAAQSGQLQAMMNPLNLKQIVPGGSMTKAQFQQYYQAFAPYQSKLTGTSEDPEGFADTVWNSYSPAEAIENWQSSQQTSSQGVLGGDLPGLPDPAMFGHSDQPSDLQMTALVVGMGLSAVVPELAAEEAGALGVAPAAAGAVTGAGTGALTGYGTTGTAEGALKGAVTGAIGGGLASGGSQAVSAETGIPSQVVTAGGKALAGAVTGGQTGAESSLVGSAVGGTLEETGLSNTASQQAAQAAQYKAFQELNESTSTFGTSQPPSTNIPAALTMPGATATPGAPMANPTNPSAAPSGGVNLPGLQGLAPGAISPGTPPSSGGADDTGNTTTSTDPSFLSSIGGFLDSPLGNVAEFSTLAGLGMSQASAQKSENDRLAGTISSQGTPYTAAGAAELSQLEGGPQMGGPIGASIAQQTGAATNLGTLAQQYSTGQLTSAQQSQVSDYVAQQQASAKAELAAAGITDPNSQQYQSRMQQIQDNATQLTQSLVSGNTTLAEGALNSVQQTYSGLLNQALTSSEFGLGAQESAVTLQIQSDTALANQLQTLFSGIAQGFGNALSGGNKTSGTTGSGVAGAAGQAAQAAGGGGGGVSSSPSGGGAGTGGSATDPNETYDPTTGEWSSGYTPGGGPDGTDYAPGVSTGAPPEGYTDPFSSQFTTGSVGGDAGLGEVPAYENYVSTDLPMPSVDDPFGG